MHFKRILMAGSMTMFLQVALTPSPASANESGCTWTNKVDLPTLWIPSSWFCFSMDNSGSNIDSMRASWRGAKLCRWRIDWITYYESGAVHWRSTGPTSSGCSRVTGERYRGAGWAPKWGRACARVYSHGKWVGGVCHRIEP